MEARKVISEGLEKGNFKSKNVLLVNDKRFKGIVGKAFRKTASN